MSIVKNLVSNWFYWLKGVPTMDKYNLRSNYVELPIFSSINLHLQLFPSKPPFAGLFPTVMAIYEL